MVAGTATDSLLGICESLWRPDLVRRAGGRVGRAGAFCSWRVRGASLRPAEGWLRACGLAPKARHNASTSAATLRRPPRGAPRSSSRPRASQLTPCLTHLHRARPSSRPPRTRQGPEELFETVSQALLSGQDRDCLAGWGAVVYVITKDKVRASHLSSRIAGRTVHAGRGGVRRHQGQGRHSLLVVIFAACLDRFVSATVHGITTKDTASSPQCSAAFCCRVPALRCRAPSLEPSRCCAAVRPRRASPPPARTLTHSQVIARTLKGRMD